MSEQTAARELRATARALELAARPGAAEPARAAPARRAADGPVTLVRVAVDAAALGCPAIAASAWSSDMLHPVTLVAIVLATLAGAAASGLYDGRRRSRPLADIRQLLTISGAATMAATAVEIVLGSTHVGDGAAAFWLLAGSVTAGARVSLHAAEGALLRGIGRRRGRTLIVGAGRIGHLAARRLIDDPALGLQPIGFLDKEPLAADDPRSGHAVRLPVLGASWDLEEVVEEHAVDHVLVAFSTAPSDVVLNLVRRCWRIGVSVMVVPRLFEVEGRRARVEHVGALPLVTLSPSDPRGRQFAVKYAIDRVVAGFMLLLLAPLLTLIVAAILVTSGRPVLFRQRRVGRDGHVFDMLKFRTMHGDPGAAGESDADWAFEALGGEAPAAAAAADRRTAIGRLLRACSLDELPQLVNVWRGDMSLVGPRPERLHYVKAFEQAIERYPDRHRVKSGLTGWAQVNGLRGSTSLTDRVEWDNFYIENWSPWLDVKILVKTIPALLGRG